MFYPEQINNKLNKITVEVIQKTQKTSLKTFLVIFSLFGQINKI